MKINDKWLTGFVDGKDCFFVEVISEEKVKLAFKVILESEDVQLLYAIKKFFGYGYIEQANEQSYYQIDKLETLAKVIIPFFEKNLLLTKKKLDFLMFRDVVLILKKEKNLHGLDQDSFDKVSKIETKIRKNQSFS